MAISFVPVKCPECGASLSIEANRSQAFCTYCGTKIIIYNDNEFIYRDEAEIKKAEARIKEAEFEHSIRMKEMEFNDHSTINGKLLSVLAILFGIAFIIIGGYFAFLGKGDQVILGSLFVMFGICFLFFPMFEKDERNEKLKATSIIRQGKKQYPQVRSKYSKMDYHALIAILSSSGFEKIRPVNLNDIKWKSSSKRRKIETVTINGKEAVPDEWYDKNDEIVITYHGTIED